MAPSRFQKLLGLAITEQALLLAEVSGGGGGAGPQVRRLGELRYPEGALPTDLGTLAGGLRQLLKKERFTARRVVVGLPAKWVLTQMREVPPADAAAAANILRLAVETAFPADIKGLVFDYAGQPDRGHASDVLLLAAPGDRLAQIDALARGAGLNVAAITASVAALSCVGRGGAGQASVAGRTVVAYLNGGGAELALSSHGVLDNIRHVAAAPAAAGAGVSAELAAELRRTFAGLPQNGSTAADHRLVIWDGGGHSDQDLRDLGGRLGVETEVQQVAALGADGALSSPASARYAPAIALALAALGGVLPVDFAHSRLAPLKPHTLRRKIIWGAALALVALGAVAYLVADTQRLATQTQNLQKRYAAMTPQLAEAHATLKRVAAARTWYPPDRGDARFLSCLRSLTLMFPDDGSLWATSIEVQGTLKGQLTAKAVSSRSALAMMDRLSASGKFTGVTLLDLRDVGPASPDVSISIAFTYVGKE